MRYFYDVGANIGQTFDWFLLKHLDRFHDHHVVCFEPSPRHLGALVARCERAASSFASVTVVSAAVGTPGLRRFYEKDAPLADSLDGAWRKNRATGVELAVPTISLVEYLLSHLSLRSDDSVTIKLDVEGAEREILADLLEEQTALDRVEQLFIEWHNGVDLALVARLRAHNVDLQEWPF